MATTPKPLSVQDLSGAVRAAVSKLKLPPNVGPYVIINPGVLCGFILALEAREFAQAQEVAAVIARQVSDHTGVTVAPVVKATTAASAAKLGIPGLKPGHITMGYLPRPETFVNFGF